MVRHIGLVSTLAYGLTPEVRCDDANVFQEVCVCGRGVNKGMKENMLYDVQR